jgi:hypothetical protein
LLAAKQASANRIKNATGKRQEFKTDRKDTTGSSHVSAIDEKQKKATIIARELF